MNICFIVAKQNEGGILDRIAREIATGFDDHTIHYGVQGVPKADHYFVMHYSLLPPVIEQVNPAITPVTTFFTHDKGYLPSYVDLFNLCHSVIAESPEGMKLLASHGVNSSILHFVPEGGDNIKFKPHSRDENGDILVCGTNYSDERKNPSMLYAVMEETLKKPVFVDPVSGLNKIRFRFLGTGWKYPDVESYEAYPTIFHNCSVYLSCSKLEGGGPNSLIEAMHANLIPVVSDTGNARQYIVDGYNGLIFPHDATPTEVADLIERAYFWKPQDRIPYADIWQTVQEHTWEKYAMNMKEIITGDYSHTNSQSLDEFDSE